MYRHSSSSKQPALNRPSTFESNSCFSPAGHVESIMSKHLAGDAPYKVESAKVGGSVGL